MSDIYVPKASNWIGAFEAGQESAMTGRKNRATQEAGRLMTSGDYRGAAAAIAPFDVRAAAYFQGEADTQDTKTRRRTYASQLPKDPKAAYSAALGDGDTEYAAQIHVFMKNASEEEKAATAERARKRVNVFGPLLRMSVDQRKAVAAANPQPFLDAGYKPEQIAGFSWTDEAIKPILSEAMGFEKYAGLFKPDRKELKRADGSSYYVDFNDYNRDAPDASATVDGGPEAAPRAAPQGGVYDQVAQFATQAGAQPGEVSYLQRLAEVESNGNPTARNGRSTGVFQFHPDTFASVGGQNINDVGDQTKSALALARRDKQYLSQIGVEPTDANVYIMHQQGAGGGPALLTAPPEVNAVAVLTPIYGNANVARQAIVNNGGREDMTAGQFVDYWRQRWAGQAARTGGAAPAAARAPDIADGRPTMPGSEAPAPEWISDGKGFLTSRNGDVKPDKRYESTHTLDPATGLKVIGDPADGIYENALGQKFQTNRSGNAIRLAGPTDAQAGDAVKKITAQNQLLEMIDLVDAQERKTRMTGPGGRYVINPAEFAKLDAFTKQLQIAYKNAAELGAITGPDVPFIESVAPNPREFKSVIQRGEFQPRLRALAQSVGGKYRSEVAAFEALGGNGKGLPPLFRSPRSTQGKPGAPKPAAGPTAARRSSPTDEELRREFGN